MNQRIVILGAGYAGALAAIRLAGKTRNADLTLINASDQFVERIRLHQRVTGQRLRQRPVHSLLRGTGVSFVQGRVTRLDLRERLVSVDTQEKPTAYDTLVYALGSATDIDSVPGVRQNALTIESPLLAEKLAQLAATGGRLLIVGGGLTAIESASEIAEAFPAIRVRLAARDAFEENLSRKGAQHVLRTFARLGVEVREHTAVTRVNAEAAVTSTGDTIPFDLCLWTGGFRASSLAREAGLAVNGRGQIRVDPTLRSVSHPEVYAVGDAASPIENPGAPIRMACATAMPMAAHAASNIAAQLAGKALKPFRFAYAIRCISLGRHEALVQWVEHNDTPRERITTGRMGAFIKEAICQYTVKSIAFERLLPGSYWWPKSSLEPSAVYAVEH